MTPGPLPSPKSFLGVLTLTLVAIGALFAVDTLLAKAERGEDQAEAVRLFTEGQLLLATNQTAAAIERFTGALAIRREDRDYQQALAEALLASGDTARAERALTDLLQRDPADALASLDLARVLVREGRMAEAVSYYHRAVYGQWKGNAARNRLSARFELIDLLVRQGSKGELLAEVLPVESEAPADPETRKKIGRLFLAAGSPANAANVFRDLVRQRPQDAEAHSGMGDAELGQGNYRAAKIDFEYALLLQPEDQAARQRLELCDQVLDLDPMQRGLSDDGRFRRSLKLVELTMKDAAACGGSSSPAGLEDLIETARKTVKQRVPPADRSDAVESNVDLANRIWQAHKSGCRQGSPSGDPVALVLARISQ